ncbi:diguanylate cyclase [Ferrimicrobium sp.]|uniref:sensor domain-containing diguanylate cyclase n=1 Tax=Ferrimicrobium sp. TaxID=2926050 RepID=UPI0026206518|nr:diguanylate cyclase [Ferrimicrobium sp.]
MAVFGLLIGVAFPFAVTLFGVPSHISLRPDFFAGALFAGVVVGLVNFGLVRLVVGKRLQQLSRRMEYVSTALRDTPFAADASSCSPDACRLNVDSKDELGDVAQSFNRLLESLNSSWTTEAAIRSVAGSVAGHLDFDELVITILDQYAARTGAAAGAVIVERDGMLSVASQRSLVGDVIGDARVLQEALRSPAITAMTIPPGVAVDSVIVSFVPRGILVIPLWFGGQALGAVVLAFSSNVDPAAIRLLEGFQPSTSVALNNALMYERFQRLAALDPLTDVYNRRFGLNRLNEEFARSTRTGSPLGILSLDIDHFKGVNDTYGHLAGDRVLRSVTSIMRSCVRAGDIVIRTGGEEFTVVIPGAGYNDVKALGERIRRTIQLERVDIGGSEISVTVSLGGLSYYGTEIRDPEELLVKADQSMYASKQSGRNQLTMSRVHELAGDLSHS